MPGVAPICFLLSNAALRTQFRAATLFTLAQAGGGGSYGGGGFGGGSGDGGGGGELFVLLFLLCRDHPLIGFPLLAVVLTVFFFGSKRGNTARINRTIRRGRRVQEQAALAGVLSSIAATDQDFSETHFLQRASRAFERIQNAWSKQELDACRAFITDGVLERFELYIAMQKRENIRNRIRNVDVTGCRIVAGEADERYQTLHVRIQCRMISYNEDLTTGRRVSGNSSHQPIEWTEVWSFLRRTGVQTTDRSELLEGRCPQCGGPVEIIDRAVCPQCSAVVNSGKYDWILAEITQDTEWNTPCRQPRPGLNELKAHDPEFSVQGLEDRASVIFWRCMMSRYFEDYEYARPVLASELSAVPKRWNQQNDHFWKTPAVGVTELIRILPADTPTGFDRAEVLVRWSGLPAKGDRRKPQAIGAQQIYSHTLILRRSAAARTAEDQVFSSRNCGHCAAPIDDRRTAKCPYCQSSLNTGRFEWVLEDVRSYIPPSATTIASAIGSTPRRLQADSLKQHPELLPLLCRILSADGKLPAREKELLLAYGERHQLSKDQLNQMLNTEADLNIIPYPTEAAAQQALMHQLIRAALVDGTLSRQETAVLQQICRRFGWVNADLNLAIKSIRRELYQEARTALRQSRRSTLVSAST